MTDKEDNDGIDMNKNVIKETGYLSRRSLIIAVILTAGIGLGSAGWYLNTSSADLTDQEVYRIIKDWHDDNPHLFVSQVEKTQILDYHDELNEWIINHNKALSANFTSIAKTLTNHNNQLIVLRAASQIVLPPTTIGTANFELRTINTDSQNVSEFAQNQPVLITGIYDGSESNATYEVRKNNAFVMSGPIGISGGTFTFAFNAAGNAELGTYTITITIDNKKDTVSFEIE